MPDLPSFHRRAESPDRALGAGTGIALAAPETVRAGGGPMPLFGAFRLPKGEAEGVAGGCMNGVVVLVRQPVAWVGHPAGGALLFGDDLVDEGETVLGYFNVDLARMFGIGGQPGTYRVSAAILHHLSEVVTVEVA